MLTSCLILLGLPLLLLTGFPMHCVAWAGSSAACHVCLLPTRSLERSRPSEIERCSGNQRFSHPSRQTSPSFLFNKKFVENCQHRRPGPSPILNKITMTTFVCSKIMCGRDRTGAIYFRLSPKCPHRASAPSPIRRSTPPPRGARDLPGDPCRQGGPAPELCGTAGAGTSDARLACCPEAGRGARYLNG